MPQHIVWDLTTLALALNRQRVTRPDDVAGQPKNLRVRVGAIFGGSERGDRVLTRPREHR